MPVRKVIAIHQPNFFPWLGYFDRLARTDVFILMDNAQFPKTGGKWTNRVQLAINGQAIWVRIPVVRAYHGTRLIRDMQIDNSKPWREKLLKTVQINYERAPFIKEVFPYLTELVNNPTELLGEYNVVAIRYMVDKLQLDNSKLILGSSLNVEGDDTTALLIYMIKAVGGTTYLCGGGGWGYQEALGQSGIEVIYQNFEHPVYPQFNTEVFVPGLSIVDALMNCGVDGTRRLLQQGNSPY